MRFASVESLIVTVAPSSPMEAAPVVRYRPLLSVKTELRAVERLDPELTELFPVRVEDNAPSAVVDDEEEARELFREASSVRLNDSVPTLAEDLMRKVDSSASEKPKPPVRWEIETPKFSSESHLRPSFLDAPAERRMKRASM